MIIGTRQFVKTVTVTGADDSIAPEDLVGIARDYPFVEFGILISGAVRDLYRFPSAKWLQQLYHISLNEPLALSAHLCGAHVRSLCLGLPNFFEKFGLVQSMFQRFQLNFHAQEHAVDQLKFIELVKEKISPRSIIFQVDGVNDKIFSTVTNSNNLNFSPLFDLSGGAGILPELWPEQLPGVYCGYAGGLSSENLTEQMQKISQVATGNIWIDAETFLRSNSDRLFDLAKVRNFLEQAKPWVIA